MGGGRSDADRSIVGSNPLIPRRASRSFCAAKEPGADRHDGSTRQRRASGSNLADLSLNSEELSFDRNGVAKQDETRMRWAALRSTRTQTVGHNPGLRQRAALQLTEAK